MKLLTGLFLISQLAVAAEPAPPSNPALIYWQASAKMPQIGSKEGRVLADVIAGKSPASEPTAAALIANAEPALKIFRRGAESTSVCDWGLMFEDGPLTVLPHTSRMQQLSRLALGKAQLLFAQHDNAAALGWILAARKAARHLASDDLLACTLIQFAIESAAISLTAAHALSLTEAERLSHLGEVRKLPTLRSVSQSMKGEKIFIDWVANEFAHLDGNPLPLRPEKASEDAASALPQTSDEDMKALYNQLTKSTASQLIDETQQYFNQAGAACELPWPQGSKELARIAAEVKANGNTLARILYPELAPSLERELRLATEAAMLSAALELGEKLTPGSLSGHVDALLGQPLNVKAEAQGFIITTTPANGMRPLSLKIGR